MVDPFGEISFLTRSENRVEVLGALAASPRTERELVEATGISDVTAGRVLDDFRERRWIREEDGTYETTRLGDLLAEDYARLEESMDLAARLGPVLDLLPVEEMDFDFRHLSDALVSDPETFGSLRALDRRKQLLRRSDRIVGTGQASDATTVVAEPFRDAVVGTDLEFETVVSRRYYERARARPELRELLREILRAGGEMYLANEAEFGVSIALFDDVATITGYDDAGNLRVGIESRADPVREWVLETYESYRADATGLEPEDFVDRAD